MAHNLHTQSNSDLVDRDGPVLATDEADVWIDTQSAFLTLLLPFAVDAERWLSKQFPRGHQYMRVHIFDKYDAESLIRRMQAAGFTVYCEGRVLDE